MIEKIYIFSSKQSEVDSINAACSEYKIESQKLKFAEFGKCNCDIIHIMGLGAETYGKNPLRMNTQIILNTNPYITAKYVVPSPLFPLGLTDSEMSMKTFEILIGKIVYAENLINEYLTFGIHTEISFSYQHNLNDALTDFLHVLKKFPQLKK